MNLYYEYKSKYLDKLRFLNGDSIAGNKTAYQSLPRSGNTFLRRYLELITGIPTGSDNPLKYVIPLQMLGFIGEAITDDTVWIIKTHDPMRPWGIDFECNKIIVCVRNPFDVISSLVPFFALWSHKAELANQYWKNDPGFFDSFIREVDPAQIENQRAVLQNMRDRKVPVYYVKFEELRENPRKCLQEVFEFLLGVEDISGTVIEKRIDEVLELGHGAT